MENLQFKWSPKEFSRGQGWFVMLIEKRTRKAFPLNWEIYVSTESEGVGGKENFSPNFLPRDIRVGVFVGGVQ